MEDHTFRPAGVAIAALVAGLAPVAAQAAAPIRDAAGRETGARETDARETLARAAGKFKPLEPFAPAPQRARKNADVPLGAQLDLPFRD